MATKPTMSSPNIPRSRPRLASTLIFVPRSLRRTVPGTSGWRCGGAGAGAGGSGWFWSHSEAGDVDGMLGVFGWWCGGRELEASALARRIEAHPWLRGMWLLRVGIPKVHLTSNVALSPWSMVKTVAHLTLAHWLFLSPLCKIYISYRPHLLQS